MEVKGRGIQFFRVRRREDVGLSRGKGGVGRRSLRVQRFLGFLLLCWDLLSQRFREDKELEELVDVLFRMYLKYSCENLFVLRQFEMGLSFEEFFRWGCIFDF